MISFMCEFYQLQYVEETIATIGKDCVVMSKLDVNSGYWQMPLDEPSQLLCTDQIKTSSKDY